jgi:hypothetical protein
MAAPAHAIGLAGVAGELTLRIVATLDHIRR